MGGGNPLSAMEIKMADIDVTELGDAIAACMSGDKSGKKSDAILQQKAESPKEIGGLMNP